MSSDASRSRVAILVTVAAAIVGFVWILPLSAEPQGPAIRSIWDGVYTRPQALRGEALFGSECRRCHTPGDLVGDSFIASWEGATLRDFYLYISSKMPPDVHEAIADFQAYADLVAHLLRSNDIPPGDDELRDDLNDLEMIRIERFD